MIRSSMLARGSALGSLLLLAVNGCQRNDDRQENAPDDTSGTASPGSTTPQTQPTPAQPTPGTAVSPDSPRAPGTTPEPGSTEGIERTGGRDQPQGSVGASDRSSSNTGARASGSRSETMGTGGTGGRTGSGGTGGRGGTGGSGGSR
jgi:hypothetical protein